VCEANESIDGVFDSVPNLPKGQGKERVREGVEVAELQQVEVAEAQPPSAELQRVEVEAAPKQMGEKRLTKEPH
jgi:hypothetical protein